VFAFNSAGVQHSAITMQHEQPLLPDVWQPRPRIIKRLNTPMRRADAMSPPAILVLGEPLIECNDPTTR